MRALLALFALALPSIAQIKPDNVLVRMIPPGTVSLLGARMDQLKTAPFFQRLIAQNKLADLDRFAKETGFDPRRDVREILLASNGETRGSVLLARGTFHVSPGNKVKSFKHGIYIVYGDENPHGEAGGFCILDSTLAAAGPLPALFAALDQWSAKAPQAVPDLLRKVEQIPASNQVWAISSGGLNMITGAMTMTKGGPDFGQILRSLQQTSFQADLRQGLDAVIQGDTKSEEDAKNLGDAARGVIGFGRLSVPEEKPELLKLWDGIHVEQHATHIAITAKVPQALIDELTDMLAASPHRMPGKMPDLSH